MSAEDEAMRVAETLRFSPCNCGEVSFEGCLSCCRVLAIAEALRAYGDSRIEAAADGLRVKAGLSIPEEAHFLRAAAKHILSAFKDAT